MSHKDLRGRIEAEVELQEELDTCRDILRKREEWLRFLIEEAPPSYSMLVPLAKRDIAEWTHRTDKAEKKLELARAERMRRPLVENDEDQDRPNAKRRDADPGRRLPPCSPDEVPLVGLEAIAECAGWSLRKINQHSKRMQALGVIRREKTRRGKKGSPATWVLKGYPTHVRMYVAEQSKAKK